MATAQQIEEYEKNGFFLIEDFLSDGEVEAMKSECRQLVKEMNPAEHNTIFDTVNQSYRDDYFIKSGDKIAYFFEKGALDEKGDLVMDKHNALNKIAHALHVFTPSFRKITFSDKVKAVVKSLSYEDPVVVQSMYIFKPPKIGGTVVDHQDCSFLYTDPPRLMGLWFALEDATLENACLWFIPGSHKEGVHNNYRMVINPTTDGPRCLFRGDKREYDASEYIPVPVKKGSVAVFDGLAVHKSEQNTSNISRNIFVIHLYDAKNAKWSPENWLQPTEVGTFQHMFDQQV